MLIINADDFGKSATVSNNILSCFKNGRITSASAMVFMEDSERAAGVGLAQGLEVGLHLNLDERFTGKVPQGPLLGYQERIATFLTGTWYNQILYNPFLWKEFDYVYKAQYEEFVRLYGRRPSHINGHHHRHLCSNILLGKSISAGEKVRRSFTFRHGEKSLANRLYRRLVDVVVERRFVTTDMFFAAVPAEPIEALCEKVQFAFRHVVELMVHASTDADMGYLMNQSFADTIAGAPRGTYRDL